MARSVNGFERFVKKNLLCCYGTCPHFSAKIPLGGCVNTGEQSRIFRRKNGPEETVSRDRARSISALRRNRLFLRNIATLNSRSSGAVSKCTWSGITSTQYVFHLSSRFNV